MGKLKVIPIYLNLIYLQDCKYLKTTKLCTTSILTCFFCGDSFGAAFVNWTRWSSWYSSFLLVEWTCNKTWQGHLVTSSWHWPRCRPDTWPRTGSGGCGWSAPTRWCRCWPAPPRSYQTSPPHSRYTEIKLNVSSATKMLKSFTFSAFWWKRTDNDKTVLLSSRPAAKFFQVVSRRAATFLKNKNPLSRKSSN